MNHGLLLGLFFLLGSEIAYGNINESEGELLRRFGAPDFIRENGPFGSRHLRFSNEGWSIQAWLLSGECHQIKYSKMGGGRPTEDQIKALFYSNGEGYSWRNVRDKHTVANLLFSSLAKDHWVRQDGMVVCEKLSRGVTFTSAYWHSAEIEAGKKRKVAERNVPGFLDYPKSIEPDVNESSRDMIASSLAPTWYDQLAAIFVIIVGAILFLLCCCYSNHVISLVGGVSKGVKGESRVQWLLRRLDSKQYRSFHNVYLPRPDGKGTTQIDHVVVSSFGVFVIETKNMGGWIFGKESDKNWTQTFPGKKFPFQNPLLQNSMHIRALRKCIGYGSNEIGLFHNLVVFVGESEFKTSLPSNVLRGHNLLWFIRKYQYPIINLSEVTRIVGVLDGIQRKTDYKNAEADHLVNLRTLHNR
ncbi:MAG: nuclease-related domain-containing protein [Verrucomicrobiales bacterium]|nr:nuclease-related domain-containing protein [Verrucomicrobiales bacterium]